MKTKRSSRAVARDRANVSAEPHEIRRAAANIQTRGKRKQARVASVLIAKHKLGRRTARGLVMHEANSVANTRTNRTRAARDRAGRV